MVIITKSKPGFLVDYSNTMKIIIIGTKHLHKYSKYGTIYAYS